MVAKTQEPERDLSQLIESIRPSLLEGDLADRVPEIRRVAADNGLSEEDLHTLNKFAFVLELLGHGHLLIPPARKNLDSVMHGLCACVMVTWRLVKKRSRFHTALYYLFFRHIRSCMVPRFQDTGQLVEKMPHFAQKGEQESEELVAFANGVSLMSEFLQPDNNKIIYMDVVSWLASSASRRWVPGGRQTPETTDRVDIFCTLTGVLPIAKKPKSAQGRNRLNLPAEGWESLAGGTETLDRSASSISADPKSEDCASDTAEHKHATQLRASFGGQMTRKLVLKDEKGVSSPAKRRHSIHGLVLEPDGLATP